MLDLQRGSSLLCSWHALAITVRQFWFGNEGFSDTPHPLLRNDTARLLGRTRTSNRDLFYENSVLVLCAGKHDVREEGSGGRLKQRK